jgi:hypothetical protein
LISRLGGWIDRSDEIRLERSGPRCGEPIRPMTGVTILPLSSVCWRAPPMTIAYRGVGESERLFNVHSPVDVGGVPT